MSNFRKLLIATVWMISSITLIACFKTCITVYQELSYQTFHTDIVVAGLSSIDIRVYLICHLGIDIAFNLIVVEGIKLTHPVTPNYISLQEVNHEHNNSILQLAFP